MVEIENLKSLPTRDLKALRNEFLSVPYMKSEDMGKYLAISMEMGRRKGRRKYIAFSAARDITAGAIGVGSSALLTLHESGIEANLQNVLNYIGQHPIIPAATAGVLILAEAGLAGAKAIGRKVARRIEQNQAAKTGN